MIWTLCTAALLTLGCGNGDAPASKKATTKASTTEAPAPAAQPDVTVSAKWKSGVNEANDGDKVGKVRLHGSMPAANGTMLYLYETEGRNVTLMDSAKVMNQAFDFGRVEVHRGFYKLQGSDAKNNCQFVMNPDEADLNLVFRSKQMTSGKSAPASAENRAWFTYENFSRVNNNQIRNLRKQLKDSPFRAQVEKQIEDKEMELVAKQHELMDANPDTYWPSFWAGKTPSTPVPRATSSTTSIPMDNSLIRSMAISDRIQGFMVAYSKGNDPGFLACIDMVKAHFEPNPATLESALYSMLEGFYNTGKEHICQYILDNYIYDEDCGADLSDVIRQRAQGIINLQVAKRPPTSP